MYKKISEDVASEFYKSTVTERRMNCIFETYSEVKKAIFGSPMLMQLIGTSQPTLEIYGSSVNSLAQKQDSDLDLTLLVNDFDISHEVILKHVEVALSQSARFYCARGPQQIQSGILLSFHDKANQIDVDLLINKTTEVINSQLVLAYGQYDVRFIKLALFLKAWNKSRFTDKMKRLNSFSIYLMLIAFLQHKEILPNLQ